MRKRLSDLNPGWVFHGGKGISRKAPDGTMVPVPRRERVGVAFDCPCGCDDRVYVAFSNPEDGGGPVEPGGVTWMRTGTTFDDLTIKPSIQRVDGCRWHGNVLRGNVVTA